jgi:hypothetical protein
MKYILKLICIICLVIFSATLFLPVSATAVDIASQTILQLQEKITLLEAKIKTLEGQLSRVPGSEILTGHVVPALPGCPAFTHVLRVGAKDQTTAGEVSKLQRMLAADPAIYPEKLVTGYYGLLTEKAVNRLQAKQVQMSASNLTATPNAISGTGVSNGLGSLTPTCPLSPLIQPYIPPSTPSIANTITVISPNGNETWVKGSLQTIRWNDSFGIPNCPTGASCSSSVPRFYDIKLVPYSPSCSGEMCPLYSIRTTSYTVAKNTYNTSYAWTVGAVLDTGMANGIGEGEYKIQVCQAGSTVCDTSDAQFKIINGPNIYLPPAR